MTEKVQINGTDIWITIEPHIVSQPSDNQQEYFTASYNISDPSISPGGVFFLGEDKSPFTFNSPVEALEYANEKLLGII